MKLIKKYGSPLKLTYLPKIAEQIQKTQSYFEQARKKYNYQ
jgi:arginine decarboxylase